MLPFIGDARSFYAIITHTTYQSLIHITYSNRLDECFLQTISHTIQLNILGNVLSKLDCISSFSRNGHQQSITQAKCLVLIYNIQHYYLRRTSSALKIIHKNIKLASDCKVLSKMCYTSAVRIQQSLFITQESL